MKSSIALVLLTSLTPLAGCAAPTADDADTASTESAVTAKHWQAALRCDDGSVLDVNTNERREFLFVVRNGAAKAHLMKAYDVASYDWKTTSSGEVVFLGVVEHGVFYPQDFTRAVAVSGRPKVQVGDEWGPTVEITRSGSDVTLRASEYIDWTFRNCR
jgi:hypothetical protein